MTNPLLRYTLVGALATAVHYAVLVVCVETARWPAWLASGNGIASAFALSHVAGL